MIKPEKTCKNCGKTIKGPRRRYCNNACKQAAYRIRKSKPA